MSWKKEQEKKFELLEDEKKKFVEENFNRNLNDNFIINGSSLIKEIKKLPSYVKPSHFIGGKSLIFNNAYYNKVYEIIIKENGDLSIDLSLTFNKDSNCVLKFIILLEKNSELKLNTLINSNDIGNANIDFLFVIKDNSHLKLNEKTNLNGNFTLWNNKRFFIQENCNVKSNYFYNGAENEIVSNSVYLEGKNNKLGINSFFLCENSKKINNSTLISCLNESNTVNLNVKGVVKDLAKVFFEAGGIIDEMAKNANLKISEKGIILNKGKIEFFPNLIINNNEVVAGHSASIKKFSGEELFYLMSRGINKESAQNLFLEEFFREFENKEEF